MILNFSRKYEGQKTVSNIFQVLKELNYWFTMLYLTKISYEN